MATASTAAGFSLRPFNLVLTATESSTNSSGNTSVVSWTLELDPTSNYNSYNLYANQNSYSVWINGVQISGNYTFDFRTNTTSNRTIASGTQTITHNADGSKTISIDATSTSTTLGTANTSATNLVLTDFVFVPSAPAKPGAVLATDRSKITVTSGVATSAVTPSDYEMRYSTNNGSTWTPSSGGTSMGTDRIYDLSSLTIGATYIFQTRAKSSEGTGAWSVSSDGVYVKPAGRRYDATSGWVPATTARRYDPTANSGAGGWVDVTQFRRYNGTTWENIS